MNDGFRHSVRIFRVVNYDEVSRKFRWLEAREFLVVYGRTWVRAGPANI
jgi:hypothetical protein